MSSERVEVYGFETDDIEEVRAAIEEALGLVFDVFDSASIGGYYFAPFCEPHAELTLRFNREPEPEGGWDSGEDGLAEPEFPSHGVLLYVEWRRTDHGCRRQIAAVTNYGELLAVEE